MKRGEIWLDFKHTNAVKRGAEKPREPLRTLAELADEFGVSSSELGRALKEQGAPACVINGRKLSHAKKDQWFKGTEVRAWWAARGVVA